MNSDTRKIKHKKQQARREADCNELLGRALCADYLKADSPIHVKYAIQNIVTYLKMNGLYTKYAFDTLIRNLDAEKKLRK